MSDLNGLDCFEATDQPETCRRCRTRTDWKSVDSLDRDNDYWIHTCPSCGYRYLLYAESDMETED